MGLYDDVHDIRYLHDDKAPHDHEPIKLPQLKKFFQDRRFAAVLGVVVLISGLSVIVYSVTKPQDTRTRAFESETTTDVTVRGTVTCVPSENDSCTLAIVTDEGDTIEINNDKSSSSSDKITDTIKEGDYVAVSGTVTSNNSLIKQTTTKKITIDNLQSLGTAKTPTPTPPQSTSSSLPTPTVDNTPLSDPTPTPQELKNNNPLPNTEYVNATYVITNKTSLNGKTVHVQSYLVGGYIGTPSCSFEEGCHVSHFVLNDVNSQNRDNTLDLAVIGGTTDKEGDYAPGQNFYTSGIVHLDGNDIYLEKVN